MTATHDEIGKDLTKRECKEEVLRGLKRRGGSPSGLDCEDPAQPIAEKGEEVGWQKERERERGKRKKKGLSF